MMAQPTWDQIAAAIQSVIAGASGLQAIWSHQNFNAPPLDYVRLSLGSIVTVGYDYVQESLVLAWAPLFTYDAMDHVVNDTGKAYVCRVAGPSAAAGGPTGTGAGIVDGGATWDYAGTRQDVALTVGGVREVALQIECFSASTVEAVGKATALSIADRIVSMLRLPTRRAALAAVGVTAFSPGSVNYIPDVVSVGFRGRATCDIRCYLPARAVEEYTTWIASITTTLTADGGPIGSIAVALSAP